VFPLGNGDEFVMYMIPTVYIFEAICWVRVSSTMTVNGYEPPVVGVPVIVPLVGPIDNPGGKLPWLTDH